MPSAVRNRFILASLLFALLPVWAQQPKQKAADRNVIHTQGGDIRGAEARGVVSWKGIPYAAPPVGKLRWRVPQAPLPWSGVRNGSEFGPACMQTDDVRKSEDCLTLNVWRPAAATTPLPVMVWIHGGAMVHGSSAMYPGDALAAQGVVVVSMNYRMGRFGFFAYPAIAAEAPGEPLGNYGYLDQLTALNWVKRNIAAFGGDPNHVTLFGESAGGGSVLALMVSPMAQGLFQAAILQSAGTPGGRKQVIPFSDLKAAEKIAVDWAHSVGITGDDAAALEQLRALPTGKLLEGASGPQTIAALSAGTVPPGMAMSIIDGQFLVEPAEVSVAAGRQAKVPVLLGANDRDLPIGTAANKNELFAIFGPDAAEAKRLYDPRGDQTLDELKQQVFADRTMTEPTRNLANLLARGEQPVYLYRFAYVSESQRGKLMGTPHGYEIPFTLDLPSALVGEKVTPTDKIMADLVSAYWLKFGKSGDPNGDARPEWPRYNPADDRILHFTNSGVIVGTDPLKTRLDLWEREWARVDAQPSK